MTAAQNAVGLNVPARRASFFSSPQTIVAGFASLSILFYLVLRYLFEISTRARLLPLFLTLIVGGVPIFIDILRKLLKREFGADVLAALSIVTSVILGEYLVGAIIVLMLSGGIALEHYATRRASSVLEALAKRLPRIAHKKIESGISDVELDDVVVGEILIVLPHEYCPVDGVVIEGHGAMDESYGRPSLTDIICAQNFSLNDVLTLAASLEQYSKHPLAAAIVHAALQRGLALQPVSEISEKPGEGVRGIIGGKTVRLTGRNTMLSAQDDLSSALPQPASGLECLLLVDGTYAAALRFRDSPRQDSTSFVDHLFPRHDVNKVILLSGDRESEVRYLAEQVGMTEIHYGKTPEDKVEIVTAEARRGETLFVGDGINDAPAMQVATVGVAFGQNSDITSEAADAVVMDASLRRVDELIHIGRRMRVIALQSAIGGMALSVAGMALAAFGYLPPVAGAVCQEIIDVLAVLNALRMTLPVAELADF